jgi:hypothetical protein
MASLDSTERAKVALAAGEALIVTTTGQCTVQGLSGAPSSTTTLTANTQTFGPYGVSAVLLVTNVSGRTDYVADNATFPLSRTEKAAFNGLVSRDGTPRNRIVKRGSKLIDTTVDTGWTFSGPGVVWSVSGEWSRRGAVSRKCDMTNATGDAVAAWSSATGVAASSIDQLIAFDLGIPDIVQPNVGGSVSVDIFISNTTTESAPGTRWVVNSNYLRQLWNEIRMCGLDADGALGANRGTGTLPYGMSKAGASGGASPLDWSQPIKFIKITITYNALNKRVLYLDSEIRIPDKIKPFVCLGQDATGSSLSDNIYTQRLAPFLASRKVPWYFTMCWVYDGLYQGTADDARRDILFGTFGCDAVNHS